MKVHYLYVSNVNLIAMFILLIISVIYLKYTFIDVDLTALGFLYIGVFFSFIYLVSDKSNREWYVWLIFIGSWITDTAAYYAGRLFDKIKLCPKKTVEGSVGELIGAALVCGTFS